MQALFRVRRRSWYPWAFAATTLLATAGLYVWKREDISAELAISVIGSIAAFYHFLYGQHNANTDRFLILFREFNRRFDALNGELNFIRAKDSGEVFSPTERQCLYDYFNLCAEEYFYFRAGYVDKEVWDSWLQGMHYFAESKGIRRLWEDELKQGSYYGFALNLSVSSS